MTEKFNEQFNTHSERMKNPLKIPHYRNSLKYVNLI